MSGSVHVESLIDAASNQRLAVLFYRKCVRSDVTKPRLVEPYSFSDGRQDLMVRCYQLEHDGDASESGWRFFMSHKIANVEKTTLPFRPRRKITLPTGEVKQACIPDLNWESEGRRVYRDYVADALADGVLSPHEKFDIEGVKQRFKLKDEDIRFVHAALYHRCLGEVLLDGCVDQDELSQIKFLHEALRQMGWAVGD